MALLALILLFRAFAAAAPSGDYRAVHHDREKDGRITPCHWTRAQLENAREIAGAARRIRDDRGDVARLVTRRGRAVSRFGYGRFRGVRRF